jgi:hypothetical protein
MPDVTLVKRCTECRRSVEIVMSEAQALELGNRRRPGGRYIQDILHTHTPAQREMFLSGICSTCWDRIFKPEDES